MDTWISEATNGFLTLRQRVAIRVTSIGMYNIRIAAIRMYGPTEKSTTAMTTSHEGTES